MDPPQPLSKASFPEGRVKKMMKMDRDIKKVNSEALHLISLSVDLFLASLADRACAVALAQKRRTIKLHHLRSAVRAHQPTSDFLLDCLPLPEETVKVSPGALPLPLGARRIQDFFGKASEPSDV